MKSYESIDFTKLCGFFCVIIGFFCLNSVYGYASEDCGEASPTIVAVVVSAASPSRCCLRYRLFIGYASSFSFRTWALWVEFTRSCYSVTWVEPTSHQHGVSVQVDTRMDAFCAIIPVLPAVPIMPVLNTTSWWVLVAFTNSVFVNLVLSSPCSFLGFWKNLFGFARRVPRRHRGCGEHCTPRQICRWRSLRLPSSEVRVDEQSHFRMFEINRAACHFSPVLGS